jgi:hypothetical protein
VASDPFTFLKLLDISSPINQPRAFPIVTNNWAQ